jgi:esterase/lipase
VGSYKRDAVIRDGIFTPKLLSSFSKKPHVTIFSSEEKHLICHSDDREELFEKVLRFLKQE